MAQTEMFSRVSIIGAGRVGTAIAFSLRNAGFEIVGVASRRLTEAATLAQKVACPQFTEDPSRVITSSDVIFITTPDHEIAGVCEKIAPHIRKGVLVIHTSGALPSKVLKPARTRGAQCLSMHPCQSFSDIHTAPQRLPGSYLCLEGTKEAVRKGKLLARRMGCPSFTLRGREKIIYHIACSMASNYLVVLVERALSAFKTIGVNRRKALEVILPLLKGTVQNIEMSGVGGALTGPIERGEYTTLEEEMRTLKREIPELRNIYSALGKEAIKIAVKKGKLDAEAERKLSRIVK